LSVGQDHPDIDLGNGRTLHSIGKLDLSSYSRLLRASAIGISLMISPHPSYPPLEMAYLGLLVLTNTFAGKDLATWHTNIRGLSAPSPENLASNLGELCDRFAADPAVGDRGEALRTDFLSDDAQFPFVVELAEMLRDPSRIPILAGQPREGRQERTAPSDSGQPPAER